MTRTRVTVTGRFILALTVLLVATSVYPASAQGPNLIQNPGFERPYVPLAQKENCAVASPWVAWYREGTREEVSQGYRFAPEYKAAFRADFPGNRVRNGELAQQWFHSYGNFEAGVLQQVSKIPVGAKVRFEIWGMSWSCDNESKGNCGGATSGDPSPMHFKLGIDPTGGGDPFSPAVIWGEENNAYDQWTLLSVDAVARNSTITAYVYSYPTYRSQDNNIYLDDASLVIVAQPPAPTRKPTDKPTATPLPTDTPVPTAVPPTVAPTAAPPTIAVPPTCAPTSAPKPCPTCAPAVVPTPVKPVTLSLADHLTAWPVPLIGLALGVVAFMIGLMVTKGGRRK